MLLLQNKDLQVVDFVRLHLGEKPEAEEMTSLELLLGDHPVCIPDGCKKPEQMAVAADAANAESNADVSTATP